MLKSFKLKNGIKVATFNLPNLKSIHIRAITKGGSIVEDPQKNGVAHFMEHMIVQGIPTFPNVESFSSYIESLAGTYGATTSTMQVSFAITLPFSHLEDGIKISSEVFFEPLFVEDAIEKERRAVLSEIRQRMDSHWYKISKFYRDSVYKKDSALLKEVGGNLEIIPQLKREDFIKYWQQVFIPQNTHLVIVGSFDEKNLLKLLETYFAKHTSSKKHTTYPKLKDTLLSGVFIRADKSLQECYVDFSWPSLSTSAPLEDRQAQSVLITILGRLRNSRLFKLLRYQKGLVYDVHMGSSLYPDMGFSYVSLQTSAENLDEVLDLTSKEISNFIQTGPSDQEVETAINFLTNQWYMAFDHPSSIAGWIENDLLWEEKISLPEEEAKLLKKITKQKIQQIMKKYWQLDKMSLVIQGPISNQKSKFNKYLNQAKK